MVICRLEINMQTQKKSRLRLNDNLFMNNLFWASLGTKNLCERQECDTLENVEYPG